MEFRTTFDIPISPVRISPDQRILCIGSCFASEIGRRLKNRKFFVDLNPFGILFNPHSIYVALDHIIKNTSFSDSDLVCQGDMWHSPLHHGSFSAPDQDDVIFHINNRISQSHLLLPHTDIIMITLGSAHAYRSKQTSMIVANCHKFAASNFEKVKLDLDKIIEELGAVMRMCANLNPKVRFLVSVSPVRYWKDGAVENQRSKARLLLACEKLTQRIPECHYFPAYELVIDDLRDYRFFTEDMLHPNEIAIEYVWKHFISGCFDKEAHQFSQRMEKFSKLISHRPIHPKSKADDELIRRIKEDLLKLQLIYPDRDFETERTLIKNRLSP